MQKYTKIIFSVLLIMVVTTFALQPLLLHPRMAFADEEKVTKTTIEAPASVGCEWYNLFCHMRKALMWVISAILQLIIGVGGLLIMLAAALIQKIIQLNEQLLNSSIVQIGFGIVLDVANMGFVLAIIIMAFGTILRLQSYGMKQMLWKLIVAALLVNFSLSIASIFINFTNSLGLFFIERASPNNDLGAFTENLADALNVSKLTGSTIDPKNPGSDFFNYQADQLKGLISIILALIVTFLLVVIFFTVALLLLVRLVKLAILVILMPFAWMFWVLPLYSDLAKKWWDNFLEWTFFFPATSFFLYLTILTFTQLGEQISGTTAATTATATVNETLMAASNLTVHDTDTITVILQTFVQIGILGGGLIAASSLSSNGAKAIMQLSNTVKNWGLGKLKGIGTGMAGRAGQGIVGSKAWQKTADWMANKPVLRTIAAGMYNLKEMPQQAVANQMKAISKDSSEANMAQVSGVILNPAEKAARAIRVLQEGKEEEFIQKYGRKKYEDLIAAAKSVPIPKEIMSDLIQKNAVAAAQISGKSIKDIVETMSVEDIASQSASVYANEDFVKALAQDPRNLLPKLYKKATSKKLEQLAIGFEKILQNIAKSKKSMSEEERKKYLREWNAIESETAAAISNPVMQRVIRVSEENLKKVSAVNRSILANVLHKQEAEAARKKAEQEGQLKKEKKKRRLEKKQNKRQLNKKKKRRPNEDFNKKLNIFEQEKAKHQ